MIGMAEADTEIEPEAIIRLGETLDGLLIDTSGGVSDPLYGDKLLLFPITPG